MKFKILDTVQKPPEFAISEAFLIWDNWNDFSFVTLFELVYVDDNLVTHEIGSVKIGYFGQKESERNLSKGESFETLPSNSFSLGQSDSYYEKLNELGEAVRDDILKSLNDIAKFPEIYEKAKNERVTRISLLRSISQTSVTGQFRRIASGGAKLTAYTFRFICPKMKGNAESMESGL